MTNDPDNNTSSSTRRSGPPPRAGAAVASAVGGPTTDAPSPRGNHDGAGRGRRLPLSDYGRHTLALRLTSIAELLMAERIPASGDAALDDEVRAIKQSIVVGLLERAAEIAP